MAAFLWGVAILSGIEWVQQEGRRLLSAAFLNYSNKMYYIENYQVEFVVYGATSKQNCRHV